MLQLQSAKWSFLLCVGISILICSVIYLMGKPPNVQVPLHQFLSCHSLPENCKVLPPSTPHTRWERSKCQTFSCLNSSIKCSYMQCKFSFIMETLSKEEKDYPLAFIITIHKDLEMFVRLLRAIYAPHNVYCIHVDAKSPKDYRVSVERLADCFPNVFLSSVSETVTYAGFSRLKADINCMEDLVKSRVKWKKVINLCGQDFPVMSNLDLVRHMQDKEWIDNNMTPGIKQPNHFQHRTEIQHKEVTGQYVVPLGTNRKKTPAPHNLEIYFGTAYYSLKREFVEYVLNSTVAKDLLEWSKDTYSPDEHYWVTLNHVKEAPGSKLDGGWQGKVRAIKWKDQEGTAHQGCYGRYVRDICIYSVEDVPWIIETNSMFANKFESTSFPEALDCLEQWHRHKVLQQAKVPIQSSWKLAREIKMINLTISV